MNLQRMEFVGVPYSHDEIIQLSFDARNKFGAFRDNPVPYNLLATIRQLEDRNARYSSLLNGVSADLYNGYINDAYQKIQEFRDNGGGI